MKILLVSLPCILWPSRLSSSRPLSLAYLLDCHTPAYMAFLSLRAPSSSASSPCNLCFSSSAEALAWRASSLRRAVNSAKAALSTGWGPYLIAPMGLMGSAHFWKPGSRLPDSNSHSGFIPPRPPLPKNPMGSSLLKSKNSL